MRPCKSCELVTARPIVPDPQTPEERWAGLSVLAETMLRLCVREGLHHRDMSHFSSLVMARMDLIRAGVDVDAA